MRRKQCPYYVIFTISVISLVLAPTASWAKPTIWVVHIKNMNYGGKTGWWPESVTKDGAPTGWPWLHRQPGDKIQFVIDSTAGSCKLVFNGKNPLAKTSILHPPAGTIDVWPAASKKNHFYIVSNGVTLPAGKYKEYWFHFLNNPACTPKPDSTYTGTPPSTRPEEPCWAKTKSLDVGKITQIGPGMDVSD